MGTDIRRNHPDIPRPMCGATDGTWATHPPQEACVRGSGRPCPRLDRASISPCALRRVLQGELAVHDRLELSRGEQLATAPRATARTTPAFRGRYGPSGTRSPTWRPRAGRTPGWCPPPELYATSRPSGASAAQGRGEQLAADRVQDVVDRGAPAVVAVRDDVVGAEAADEVRLGRVGDGAHDPPGAARPGQLHGQMADAARRRGDQRRLAGLGPGRLQGAEGDQAAADQGDRVDGARRAPGTGEAMASCRSAKSA